MAAVAEAAGSTQDCAKPSEARATRMPGKTAPGCRMQTKGVTPVVKHHSTRPTVITLMPPSWSAMIPAGTWQHAQTAAHVASI